MCQMLNLDTNLLYSFINSKYCWFIVIFGLESSKMSHKAAVTGILNVCVSKKKKKTERIQ